MNFCNIAVRIPRKFDDIMQDDLKIPELIFHDKFLAAINKPHGQLTHPSSIAMDAGVTAMQSLRNLLGHHVYPIHRLDRKTGGVLLFAMDPDSHKAMQRMFSQNQVIKEYLAIVRGYTEDEGIIDYQVKSESGKLKNALTTYRTLCRTEINIPFGKHETSRYSLVLAEPKTGRMHQLRIHFSHILHPIIGDRPHGCNKQNRLFREKWGMTTMLLHAHRLIFKHPVHGSAVTITAPRQNEFVRMLEILDMKPDN
jgi:tRNA pseudouridine65 synthase